MQDLILEEASLRFIQDQIIKKNKGKIIIFDLWAENCTMCKPQEMILKQLETNANGFLEVFKLNVEYECNYDFAKQIIKINILPTILLFNRSINKRFMFNGLTNIDILEYFIDNRDNKSLCVNCNKLNTNKSNDKGFYFCRKHKSYVHYKDSC